MNPFSIVIPTRGMSDSLSACLAAVASQPAGLVEDISVVFDSPAPDAALPAMNPAARALCTGAARGPAAARNTGAGAARGPWLVFVDDDVRLAPDALESLRACIEASPAQQAITGRIVPDPSVPQNAYTRLAYGGVAHTQFDRDIPDAPFWQFCTSAAAVRADLFKKAGGFDTRFTDACYEDPELAFRMREAGAGIFLCAGFAGFHLRRMDRAWFVNRCGRGGRFLALLHDLHPGTITAPQALARRLRFLWPLPWVLWRAGRLLLPAMELLPAGAGAALLRPLLKAGTAAGYCRAIPGRETGPEA